ncbi:lipoprotein YvcA [Bacillus sp. WMMC1349]|uniref:lipoprotein YvcA n=1 Tax=Bacillus sp. WMMC1349 TaxID=2736254 RepID=UPI00155584F2|nr:lipoprotein YvcA [Bacillus sp. WMMC1349]NPC94506.1 lipoprotein YvcA [Bacillus sp. WMMC1349]
MKKMIIICFTLILVVTGGCSMNDKQNSKENNKTEAVKPIDMDPKDLPKVPAFQDEKTREYMASTKEVEPGYYLLESKLKGFTMLFPEEAVYDDFLSSLGKDKEIISFRNYNKKTNVDMSVSVEYYRYKSYINDPDEMMEQVRKDNGYKGDFEKIQEKNKNIYFAYVKTIHDDTDTERNTTHSYIGYIKSKDEDYVGIVFTFDFVCLKHNQSCSLNVDEARKKATKIVKSITFKINREEKNGN